MLHSKFCLDMFENPVLKSYAELVTAKMIMSRNGSVPKMSSHRQTTSDTFGPQRRKDSDQVRHKPGCTATGDG